MALTPRLVSGSSAKRPGPSGINAMLLVDKNSTGQPWLAVGKAGARGIAGHALDQGAEAGPVTVRAVLPPTGHTQDDQPRVAPVQKFRAETHRFERAGAEILDLHPCGGGEVEEQFAPPWFPQAQRHALLVAAIDLPMDADAVGLPGAQRVAARGVLDLDHLGAEIGELQADHISRDEARHVDDPHPVERTRRSRLERFFRHTHCSDPILRPFGAALCWTAFSSPMTTASKRRACRCSNGSPPSLRARSGSSRPSTTRAASRTPSACTTRSGSASVASGATLSPEHREIAR